MNTREIPTKLLEAANDGALSYETLAKACLDVMPEDDTRDSRGQSHSQNTPVEINDDDLVRIVETVRNHPHEVFVINYWYIDDEDNDTSISVHATLTGAQTRAIKLCAEQYDEQMTFGSTARMVSRLNDEGHTVHEITTEGNVVLESWTVYPTTLET